MRGEVSAFRIPVEAAMRIFYRIFEDSSIYTASFPVYIIGVVKRAVRSGSSNSYAARRNGPFKTTVRPAE